MSAIGTCPECGASRPLEEYLTDAAQRQALAAALSLDARLAPGVLAYLKLWAKPGKRTTAPTIVRVLSELRALVAAGQVTHDRVSHPAPVEYWIEGLQAVADSTTLTPPLASHGYLIKAVHGIAARGRAGEERAREKALQSPRHDGQADVGRAERQALTARRIQIAELREQLNTLRRLSESPENACRIERVCAALSELGADPDSPAGGTAVVAPPEGLAALAANAPPEARAGLRKLGDAMTALRRPLTQPEAAP